MEETVKARLLLTSLFLFVQMPTMQAQETLDLAKVTCEQLQGEKLAYISRDIMLVLVGYYNGKRNNMTINIQTIKNDEEKVRLYCYHNLEMTVLDAIKNVGLGK